MTMVYDERYMPLLKHAKLATVVRVCHRGVPPFNPAVLTTMIDRWRPETQLPPPMRRVDDHFGGCNHDPWTKNIRIPSDRRHGVY